MAAPGQLQNWRPHCERGLLSIIIVCPKLLHGLPLKVAALGEVKFSLSHFERINWMYYEI